jgi:CHAT domain-containing protein
MIKLYQLHKQPQSPATALKEAQNWLRTVPYSELILLYKQLAAQLENDAPQCSETLEAAADIAQDEADTIGLDHCPYAHPYYWAGFILTGKL